MNLLFMQNGLAPYGVPRNGLIALYDPGRQMLTGATGQTLIDFSGKGNSAQLGSTAGADTNDPSYSGAGLVFGTDDYAKSSSPAFDDLQQFTVITAFKTTNAPAYQEFFNKGGKKILQTSGGGQQIIFSQSFSEGSTMALSNGQIVTNQCQVVACAWDSDTPLISPKIWINQIKRNVTGWNASGSLVSDTADDLYVGNRQTLNENLQGVLYLQAWYNRILTDAEYMSAYNGLKRLMNSRGVVI